MQAVAHRRLRLAAAKAGADSLDAVRICRQGGCTNAVLSQQNSLRESDLSLIAAAARRTLQASSTTRPGSLFPWPRNWTVSSRERLQGQFGGPVHAKHRAYASGKQKPKSSVGGEIGIKISPTCMCARCQIMRTLVERLEQIKDTVEHKPQITLKHVTTNFARSSGPGGQNVNKVNTKVDMRFNVAGANWLPERVRSKLLENERNRINKEGEIVISSSKTRSQKNNLDDALGKLQDMIDAAYVAAPSEKDRIMTLLKRLDKGRASK